MLYKPTVFTVLLFLSKRVLRYQHYETQRCLSIGGNFLYSTSRHIAPFDLCMILVETYVTHFQGRTYVLLNNEV